MHLVRRLFGTSCLIALGALSAAACSSAITDTAAERSARAAQAEVTAAVVRGAVEIRNGTGARIFYNVVNPNFLGDWGPCTDANLEWCLSLAPGETARVAPANFFGAADGISRVIVYWWKADVQTTRKVEEIPLAL